MALKALSLLLLEAILIQAGPQSYQNLFLQRINPQYDNTVYGGNLIEDHVYSRTPGKLAPQAPILQSNYHSAPQVAVPIRFNGVVASNGG